MVTISLVLNGKRYTLHNAEKCDVVSMADVPNGGELEISPDAEITETDLVDGLVHFQQLMDFRTLIKSSEFIMEVNKLETMVNFDPKHLFINWLGSKPKYDEMKWINILKNRRMDLGDQVNNYTDVELMRHYCEYSGRLKYFNINDEKINSQLCPYVANLNMLILLKAYVADDLDLTSMIFELDSHELPEYELIVDYLLAFFADTSDKVNRVELNELFDINTNTCFTHFNEHNILRYAYSLITGLLACSDSLVLEHMMNIITEDIEAHVNSSDCAPCLQVLWKHFKNVLSSMDGVNYETGTESHYEYVIDFVVNYAKKQPDEVTWLLNSFAFPNHVYVTCLHQMKKRNPQIVRLLVQSLNLNMLTLEEACLTHNVALVAHIGKTKKFIGTGANEFTEACIAGELKMAQAIYNLEPSLISQVFSLVNLPRVQEKREIHDWLQSLLA
jgi:hypothetical protein